ncbi:hypothetical protein NIES4073_35170 [Kalymmatonema gypsitolerans NIES-4073]|nr:hypothetical protein NIES4073_35170 [Scytonema sp. NIES-4073]
MGNQIIAKHRFGLHRFGEGTLLGVYLWLVLSLIAYILAHWVYLSFTERAQRAFATTNLPNWEEAAQIAIHRLPTPLTFVLDFT